MRIHNAGPAAFALALLTLPALLALPARAADSSVKTEIEAQMKRFQQAFREKNLAGVRAITTPDFTMKSPDGQVSSRREAEAALATEMRAITKVNAWNLRIERLDVKGNVATAVVSEYMKASFAANGMSVANESRSRMRETWVKTPSGWRYKRCEAISAKSNPAGMQFVSSSGLDTRSPRYIAARKAIEAQYAAYQRAVRRKDIRAAMATMTSDATVTYPKGDVYNRKKTEAALRATLAGLRTIRSWELKIARLELTKDTAVTSMGERLVSTFADVTGKLHDQTLVDFYQDTWVPTANGWRLKSTRIVRGTVTIDGKTGDAFK